LHVLQINSIWEAGILVGRLTITNLVSALRMRTQSKNYFDLRSQETYNITDNNCKEFI
jgi:hypothetical protein